MKRYAIALAITLAFTAPASAQELPAEVRTICRELARQAVKNASEGPVTDADYGVFAGAINDIRRAVKDGKLAPAVGNAAIYGYALGSCHGMIAGILTERAGEVQAPPARPFAPRPSVRM